MAKEKTAKEGATSVQAKAARTKAPKWWCQPRARKLSAHDNAQEFKLRGVEARAAHRVEHVGATIVLTGTDVMLRVMTPAEQKTHDIKSIDGAMGQKCKSPLTLTFKNEGAAGEFFELCLYAEKEQEEYISSGNKTTWYFTSTPGMP